MSASNEVSITYNFHFIQERMSSFSFSLLPTKQWICTKFTHGKYVLKLWKLSGKDDKFYIYTPIYKEVVNRKERHLIFVQKWPIQTPFRGLFCWNALLLIGALIKIQTIKLIRRQLRFSFYHLCPFYFTFCTFHDIFATCLSARGGQRWSFVALNTVFSFYKHKKVLSPWHLP